MRTERASVAPGAAAPAMCTSPAIVGSHGPQLEPRCRLLSAESVRRPLAAPGPHREKTGLRALCRPSAPERLLEGCWRGEEGAGARRRPSGNALATSPPLSALQWREAAGNLRFRRPEAERTDKSLTSCPLQFVYPARSLVFWLATAAATKSTVRDLETQSASLCS